ncbi:hypothetical protein P171DRAFT_432946 [Karstenula rhodostoma CBS 690.94]|uniref:Uncharacterized protein n=1 Tax=Karstenula rhodostoma CBS 690.94 TaxID=1392251 RepID=A0A9P4PJ26_9PLEO|nr:hypothetical protein P171DRAFT_432946 [Karstenula rhodostoma CBS 690.94]
MLDLLGPSPPATICHGRRRRRAKSGEKRSGAEHEAVTSSLVGRQLSAALQPAREVRWPGPGHVDMVGG